MTPHEFPAEPELPAEHDLPVDEANPDLPAAGLDDANFDDANFYAADLYDAFDLDDEEPLPEPGDFCFDDDWEEEDFPFAA